MDNNKVEVNGKEQVRNPHVVTCESHHRLVGIYTLEELNTMFEKEDGIVKIYSLIHGVPVNRALYKYIQSTVSHKWFRFIEFREDEGIVELKPVCPCGHVFDELSYEKVNTQVLFTPAQCPVCGLEIKRISITNQLLKGFIK